MSAMIVSQETLSGFRSYLYAQEKSAATIEKYVHDAGLFITYLNGRPLTRELAAQWKETLKLSSPSLAPATINGRIAAVNALFRYLGCPELCLKTLRIQKRVFSDESRELTRQEYERLVRTAVLQGRDRLALLFEAICSTGIRVSEVQYLTVEAVRSGMAEIALKGKIREILLPKALCCKLLQYAKKHHITSGHIFRTRSGRPLSRKQIWAEMKAICRDAHVSPDKVFPHNLRHLFARSFYTQTHDVVRLSDVLGHSSIQTTRIYLKTSGREHQKVLESLCLIL